MSSGRQPSPPPSMDGGLRGRLIAGFLGMLGVVGTSTTGYYLLGEGRWSIEDCVYMAVITLTTVGYGEVLEGFSAVPHARLFTALMIVLGIGVFLYFASTLTAFIIEGDLTRVLRNSRMRQRINKMKNHIIVCGVGSTGRHVVEELLVTRTPTVAIDVDAERLEALVRAHPKAPLAYVVGDATDDSVLAQAHLDTARGLVAALAHDKDNLYLVVSSRQANPTVRIVARGTELSVLDKLRKAGADRVVSPNFIGGMRMVSEMIRPAVVQFLDEMLRVTDVPVRIEEVTVGARSALVGRSVRNAAIRERSRVSVLAIKQGPAGSYLYNPDADFVIEAGCTLVVLGASADVDALRDLAR